MLAQPEKLAFRYGHPLKIKKTGMSHTTLFLLCFWSRSWYHISFMFRDFSLRFQCLILEILKIGVGSVLELTFHLRNGFRGAVEWDSGLQTTTFSASHGGGKDHLQFLMYLDWFLCLLDSFNPGLRRNGE